MYATEEGRHEMHSAVECAKGENGTARSKEGRSYEAVKRMGGDGGGRGSLEKNL